MDYSVLTMDHSVLTVDPSVLTVDHSVLTVDPSVLTVDPSLTVDHSVLTTASVFSCLLPDTASRYALTGFSLCTLSGLPWALSLVCTELSHWFSPQQQWSSPANSGPHCA